MNIIESFKSFFERKRYWYFLPKKIRFIIFNIKTLKKYHTKTGIYYLPFFAFKDGIRNKIIKNEITDEVVFKKVQDFIKPNSIVLDLGANFGQMSILWSKCKPNVEVYAFEASKYVFNILKKNILVNSANVKPFNVLISNESNKNQLIKKSQLNQYTTYGTNKIETSSSLGNGKGIDTIEALRIDDLNYTEQISVMKIDVQGYDLEALKGSEKTIREHKMPIIFEYEKKFEKEFKYTFKDFEKFIDKINYKIETKIDEINYLILPK